MMFKQDAIQRVKLSTAWIAVVSMVLAVMLPLFATQPEVSAAVLSNRKVTIGSSEAGLDDVVYNVEVDIATNTAIAGVVVAFCDSPLIGTLCTAPTDLDTNEGTTTVAAGANNDLTLASLAEDSATDTYYYVYTFTSESPAVDDTLHLTIGTGAANNGVDNPSATGAFYARVLTFATAGNAQSWNPAAGADTHVDDGGVALSTANQIEIDARVQETMVFCVGTTIAGDDCTGVSGTTIDMGVLSNGSISHASVEDTTFNTQVTTNAQSGVSMTYYGDNLAVGGATCADLDTDVADNNLTDDYCINRDDAPDTNGAISAGSEQWGINMIDHTNATAGETTDAFDATAEYDGDDADNDEFAFVPNSATEMASSSGVVDSETIEWDIGATINLTTPSGLYETTLTFVATGTF